MLEVRSCNAQAVALQQVESDATDVAVVWCLHECQAADWQDLSVDTACVSPSSNEYLCLYAC